MGDNHLKQRRSHWNQKLKIFNFAIIGIFLLSLCTDANAARWSITPSVTLQQIFTDNINLDPKGQEQDCSLTQVIPGLDIEPREEGGRVEFDFDFQVQSPLSLGCSQANNQAQIQYTSSFLAEIIKESVFLESQSSIRQQNTSNNNRVTDNSLANTGNLTKVTGFTISPYWLPHFGGYTEGEVRFKFNVTDFDNENSNSSATAPTFTAASNSTTHTEQIDFRSGSRFKLLTWRLHFFNEEQKRDNSFNNVRYQDYNAEVRYHLSRKFNVFAAAGNFNNSFQQNSGSSQNGAFFQIGAQWRPSRYFDIEGAVGRNSFINFGYNPSNRTSLDARLTRQDVGRNAGGNVFQLSFRHRARRSTWIARYFEETTTVQQRLAQPVNSGTQDLIDQNNPDGSGPPPPSTENETNPSLTNILLPDLTDELFTRKRGEIAFTANTTKNRFGLTVYNERREFEQSLSDQDVYGVIGNWSWQIRRNVFSELTFNWQTNDSSATTAGNSFNNDRLNVAFLLGRTISRHISVNVRYNFLNQDSDSDANEFRENRITGNLIYQF